MKIINWKPNYVNLIQSSYRESLHTVASSVPLTASMTPGMKRSSTPGASVNLTFTAMMRSLYITHGESHLFTYTFWVRYPPWVMTSQGAEAIRTTDPINMHKESRVDADNMVIFTTVIVVCYRYFQRESMIPIWTNIERHANISFLENNE